MAFYALLSLTCLESVYLHPSGRPFFAAFLDLVLGLSSRTLKSSWVNISFSNLSFGQMSQTDILRGSWTFFFCPMQCFESTIFGLDDNI